jgi:hypothetical protein
MKTMIKHNASAAYQKAGSLKEYFFRVNAYVFISVLNQQRMAVDFLRACL